MMEKQYYIICGKFFDGINMELKENIRIITEGKNILSVGEKLACPSDAEIVDLSELTVTPGLIDSHVHYEFVGPATFSTYAITDTDEMKALNTVHNAMESLQRGFTTIRTTGTAFRGFGCMDAKRAIDRGMFPASRMIVAPHALGISGGHWDFSVFYMNTNPYVCELLEQPFAFGAGAYAFKQLVRKQVKYGADFIKIMAAGGFASPGDDPGEMQLDREEIKAIIDTAKLCSKPVAAHAYTSETIDLLIELGISEIEHGTLMKPHTANLIEEKDIYYVPTIFSLMPPDEDSDLSKLPPKSPAYERKLAKYGAQLSESRKVVIDLIKNSKATIGLGSDIVALYSNCDSWREFKAWRDIGIGPLRTLVAATSANAKIIGRNDLGAITAGKTADIAGWGRDIMTDHKAVSECDFVMKEGIIYKTKKS